MNINNIVRIEKESDVLTLTKEHSDEIVMFMYCIPSNTLNIFLKRYLAKNFPQCFFVLVNVDNKFVCDLNKTTYDINTFPYVVFYYDERILCSINMADANVILKTLHELVVKQKSLEEEKIKNKEKNIIMNSAREYQVSEMSKESKLHKLEVLEKLNNMKKNK